MWGKNQEKKDRKTMTDILGYLKISVDNLENMAI